MSFKPYLPAAAWALLERVASETLAPPDGYWLEYEDLRGVALTDLDDAERGWAQLLIESRPRLALEETRRCTPFEPTGWHGIGLEVYEPLEIITVEPTTLGINLLRQRGRKSAPLAGDGEVQRRFKSPACPECGGKTHVEKTEDRVRRIECNECGHTFKRSKGS